MCFVKVETCLQVVDDIGQGSHSQLNKIKTVELIMYLKVFNNYKGYLNSTIEPEKVLEVIGW